MQQHHFHVPRLVVAGLATFTACTAFAQEAATDPAAPDPTAWQTSAGLNFGLTAGNSENFLMQANLGTVKKWEQNEFFAGADLAYGETTTKAVNAAGTALIETESTTVNNYGGFLQYNRLLSERLYVGVKADGRADEIAGVDYRFAVTANLGYYLVKEKDIELVVESGPGYVWEELEGRPADDYMTIRFAERFKWQFSKTARLFQDVEYLPRVDDFGDYVIQGQIGVEADLTKKLAMRVVFQDTYRSHPAAYAGTAPGVLILREENDMKLLAGITYKF